MREAAPTEGRPDYANLGAVCVGSTTPFGKILTGQHYATCSTASLVNPPTAYEPAQTCGPYSAFPPNNRPQLDTLPLLEI